MRGKEKVVREWLDYGGITPAHAGKRLLHRLLQDKSWDHPRTCGEKTPGFYADMAKAGSPPHMRGKVQGHPEQKGAGGITPAHAGKSTVPVHSASPLQDHPRTCGEKKRSKRKHRNTTGSPPHMRGKEWWQKSASCPMRITPAHAGKRLKRSRSTVPHAAIVPLFPSVCNKPAGSDGSPAGHDAPPFLPLENAAPASPAYNLRSL